MTIEPIDLVFPVAGYLIGSVPFGWLIARVRGLDITKLGSGNIGATNVGRVLGPKWGLLVFVLDLLKGAAPTMLALGYRGQADAIVIATGLAAILGHVFSIFLRFRGGKGVATAAGVVVILFPVSTGFAVLAFLATLFAGRIMSLAAVVAAVTLAGAQVSLTPDLTNVGPIFAIVAATLVVFRHGSNLRRIADGTEVTLYGATRLPDFAPGIHSLTLALWVGAGWFFSILAAPQIFAAFGELARHPPEWIVVDPNRAAEVGSRLAGAAVAPLFPTYFLLQAVCGVIAAGSAIGWAGSMRQRRNIIYAALLVIALVLVAAGWPIVGKVSELRDKRYASDAARTAFATWHTVSLILNLSSLALVTFAVGMFPYRNAAFSRRTGDDTSV